MKTQFEAIRCFQNNGPEYWIVTDFEFKGLVLAQCDSEDKARLIAHTINIHNELIQTLKVLSHRLNDDDRESVSELIKKAESV